MSPTLERIEREIDIFLFLRDQGLTVEESCKAFNLVFSGRCIADAIEEATRLPEFKINKTYVG